MISESRLIAQTPPTAPTPPQSQTSAPSSGYVQLSDPLNINDGGITVLAIRINRAILGVVGIVALFMFIYAGIRILTSQGNSDTVKTARNTMVYAAIGLAVIFSSYAILNFIITTLTTT